MLGVGLEPTRPCGHNILSVARKPIPPPEQRPRRDLVTTLASSSLRLGRDPASRLALLRETSSGLQIPTQNALAFCSVRPRRDLHPRMGVLQTPVLATSPRGHLPPHHNEDCFEFLRLRRISSFGVGVYSFLRSASFFSIFSRRYSCSSRKNLILGTGRIRKDWFSSCWI